MSARELAYCGIFGAAALLLPVLFHLLHLGHLFMPMYLPLVALAFFVRPRASALTAGIAPLLSATVTGMPPFYPPVAPVMSVELALMAALIGGLWAACPRLPVWAILTAALVTGRVVNAGLLFVAAKTMTLPAGFAAGISLVSGWPGLVLMMAVIPSLVRLAGRHPRGRESGPAENGLCAGGKPAPREGEPHGDASPRV